MEAKVSVYSLYIAKNPICNSHVAGILWTAFMLTAATILAATMLQIYAIRTGASAANILDIFRAIAITIYIILIIAHRRRAVYIDPLVGLYMILSLFIVIPDSVFIAALTNLDADLVASSMILAMACNMLANTIIYRDITKKLRKRIAKTFRENGYTAVENMLGFRVHGRTMCYVVRAEKIREGTIIIDTMPSDTDTVIDIVAQELGVPCETLRSLNFHGNDKRYIALAILIHTKKHYGKEVLTATILSLPHKAETITVHQP